MSNHCGTCTACCRVFNIPEFSKPAGKWCEHCAIGKGCKIYEARPQVCRDYKCLWLLSQEKGAAKLPDDLRPDRCKVVFGPTTNDIIMSATVMPGASWRRKNVMDLIARLNSAGMKVVVSAPASTTHTMITKNGERQVKMTAPDANGMQWSIPEHG